MEYALASSYAGGMPAFGSWKRADAVVVLIVAIAILGLLGLGVAAYCAYRGMNFEYAVRLSWSVLKLACTR